MVWTFDTVTVFLKIKKNLTFLFHFFVVTQIFTFPNGLHVHLQPRRTAPEQLHPHLTQGHLTYASLSALGLLIRRNVGRWLVKKCFGIAASAISLLNAKRSPLKAVIKRLSVRWYAGAIP